MNAQLEALKGFARDILSCEAIDGFDVEEIALKHGLLAPMKMKAPCGDCCVCAEVHSPKSWPVICNRRTNILK